MKHLLSIDDLGRRRASRSCSTSPTTSSRSTERPIPKVPALRGKTVRQPVLRGLDPHPAVSFETAAKRLVGRHDDVHRRHRRQREQGREPARHRRDHRRRWASTPSSCATAQRRAVADRRAGSTPRSSTPATAGTSTRRRRCSTATRCAPTLDRARRLDGLRIAIVGDIKHSRVARSNVAAFTALGADVTLWRRRRCCRRALDGWPVDVSPRPRRRAARSSTSLYLLRMQHERMDEALVPSAARVHAPLRPHRRAGRPPAPSTRWSCTPGR